MYKEKHLKRNEVKPVIKQWIENLYHWFDKITYILALPIEKLDKWMERK